MTLLAMVRLVRYPISPIRAGASVGPEVVGWVWGRRARATIDDTRWSRGLKQAIFNTEIERGTRSATEKHTRIRRSDRGRKDHTPAWIARRYSPTAPRTKHHSFLLCSLCVARAVSVVKIACLPAADRKPRADTVSDLSPNSSTPPASRCVSLVKHVLATNRGTVLEQVARQART